MELSCPRPQHDGLPGHPVLHDRVDCLIEALWVGQASPDCQVPQHEDDVIGGEPVARSICVAEGRGKQNDAGRRRETEQIGDQVL